MYKKLIITCCLLFSTQAIAKKQALLIGVSDYGGDPKNDLMGIDLDINKMKQLFKSWGFTPKVLYNEESLKIEDYLKKYAKSLSANDSFAFYYSGHGSFVADKNGDEVDDHRDEALVLSDGVKNIPYIDDDLNHYLNAIKAKKLIIFDSCHSGTANRGNKSDSIRVKTLPSNLLNAPLSKGFTIAKKIGGDYIVLSASQDSEESLATTGGSLFTNQLYKLLNSQVSLESIREEATYNIVSYAKQFKTKPHHPKFTYSNLSFGNSSIESFLKTSSAPIEQAVESLQTKLDRLVNNPQIDKINITNNKDSYNTGEFITFDLDTKGKQGYLTTLFVEKNKVTVLYPNPKAFSKLISGSYTVPKDFGNFKIRAFKNCNGCQKDKTSIYMMLTPQPLTNIANMTNKKLLSFAKGSTMDKAISKDVALVFDESSKTPTKTPSSTMMVGRYEFFVY